MKFNVSSTTLFAQLQSVSRVIASKNNKLPILDNILFDLEGQTLTLSASDEETTIRTSLEVENAEGAGKVAFDAKGQFLSFGNDKGKCLLWELPFFAQ